LVVIAQCVGDAGETFRRALAEILAGDVRSITYGGTAHGLDDVPSVYAKAAGEWRQSRASLFRVRTPSLTEGPAIALRRARKIERAVTYIGERFKEDLSVQRVADACGVNPAYLGRAFKEAVGEKMSLYIHRIRIREASRLLQETDLLIYEIAEDVGYRDLNLFRRMFKSITGIRPSSLRKTPPTA